LRLTIERKKRAGVSPVIATLLLIAIAVAAAIIVYAFVTGLIGGLTSSGASLVVVSGSLTVPSGSGTGSLVVTVNNKASNAITQVTIGTTSADGVMSVTFAAQNGGAGGIATNGNNPVQVLNSPTTIAIGSSASAIGGLTVAANGATAGTTYTFVVSAYIGTSTTPNIQTFSVTAQI